MASRRVLGHALGEHHDAQLACGALVMAVAVRGGQVPGVIFHSDRSPQDENPKNAAAIIGSNGQTYSADLKDIAGYTNLGNGTFHLSPGRDLDGISDLPGAGGGQGCEGSNGHLVAHAPRSSGRLAASPSVDRGSRDGGAQPGDRRADDFPVANWGKLSSEKAWAFGADDPRTPSLSCPDLRICYGTGLEQVQIDPVFTGQSYGGSSRLQVTQR